MKNSVYSKLIIIGLILVGLVGCSRSTSSHASRQTDPPNIIVILADDAGYVDFGFMASQDLETPRIDQLAADGVIFTDAHVSASVCAPSRAGLITGRYQQRFGHECNGIPADDGLRPSVPTIGKHLQQQGYRTMALGKWHLGLGDAYHPNVRGFDDFYGFLSGSRSYFPNENQDQEGKPTAILHNREHVQFEGYLTDVLGDRAVQFIDQQQNKPFFMYLAFNAVHTPMHAKEEHLEKYRDHPRQKLAAMTWSMDENIGKVIDKLKSEGLYENTLIFFLSDNGGAYNNQSSSGPLKGWKGNKFEGGHRVPFTVTWPRRVKGGQTFDQLTSALDIFATSVQAAGIDPNTTETDGVDLLPYLNGERQGAPHDWLFWRKGKMAAVRKAEWKLIRLEDYGYRVYDLEANLGETENLTIENPQMKVELQSGLESWEKELEAPRWLEGDVWPQVTYEIHQALMENREPNYTNPGAMRRFKGQ
ncbi:sulfatase family protein [Flavilitoribacter nigricans]|uniref:Sulfatase N-terminal domain-containing protein n=1 Tax=Flavilitoribacter nigricans (strain ATCC 23147 / DSM 23189 / NBRC 102662 / NCIMB 1420 / SS-2) TaxID=1122177 RepID=A0A2D0NJB0_FLAN2|nr:sulfatase-like hydrolase/transferase [Flavilitoribacter nigricans]PHN08584.1 hypothetical protein CRP01_01345 [Flavilitoribacter nigricans DSM 23189 = NBRC 102662]